MPRLTEEDKTLRDKFDRDTKRLKLILIETAHLSDIALDARPGSKNDYEKAVPQFIEGCMSRLKQDLKPEHWQELCTEVRAIDAILEWVSPLMQPGAFRVPVSGDRSGHFGESLDIELFKQAIRICVNFVNQEDPIKRRKGTLYKLGAKRTWKE